MAEAAPVTSPVAHGVGATAAVAGFLAAAAALKAAATASPAASMAASAALGLGMAGPGDSHVATGAPTVRVNGLAAGRVGDLTDRGETIVAGSSSVFINGRPAARMGDPTDKAGIIIGGSRNVFIGGGTTAIGDLGAVMNPECAALAKAAAMAAMSAHAYDSNSPVPPGYSLLDPNTEAGRQGLADIGLKPGDVAPGKSGFHADVFSRDGVDGKQYVVAYKGTADRTDLKNDIQQGIGSNADEYGQAIRLSRAVSQAGISDVTYTGHSLGGGLASASAASQNQPATTFNAAGLSTATVGGYPAQSAPVDAYYVSGEPLSAVQDHREGLLVGTMAAVPAIGLPLAGFSAYRGFISKSPIVPRAYGTRHVLKRTAPAGVSMMGRLNVIKWHSMDWMTSSIAARQQAVGCP